jgi:nitrile hydratase accessory protein
LTSIEALCAAANAVAPLPRDADGDPVFAEPWQANAFAMTLTLYEREVFSWPEWVATLAAEIKSAQAADDPDDGSTYYLHWLAAIERLTVEKGLATGGDLDNRRAAWERAAHATPHGQPILLANDPRATRSSGE